METTTEKPKSGSLFSSRIVANKSTSGRTAVDVEAMPEAPRPAAPTTAAAPIQASSATVLLASSPNQLTPCPTCGSAIRWLNAAGTPRCIGCQPPKFAGLVRSLEILVAAKGLGFDANGRALDVPIRRWETLVELPGGRLASETGIRELVARGELDPLTAASVGVGNNSGGSGGGVGAGGVDAAFNRFVEVEPDEFFRAKGA